MWLHPDSVVDKKEHFVHRSVSLAEIMQHMSRPRMAPWERC